MRCIGVDIGGTGLRAAVHVPGESIDLRAWEGFDPTPDGVVQAVQTAVESLGGADCVGVGVPGFVREGVVLGSPNLQALAGVDLQSRLREAAGCPVWLLNDANAAAMGAWAEEGQGADMVVITLGTGVGGGIVLNGAVWTGPSGTGAELGHVHIGGSVPCGCGAQGCLETWVGASGLMRRAADLGHSIGGVRALVEHADAGELWAQHLLHDAALALGQGVRTVLNLLGVEQVLFTGGVAHAEAWLRPGVEAHLAAQGIASNTERVRFVWKGHAARWAVAGAAVHALSATNNG